MFNWKTIYNALIGATILISGCSSAGGDTRASGEALQIVATTSIVADIVSQVAGEQVNITTLLPPNSDPHTYQPTPQDIVTISKADVIFTNGAGLEVFLEPIIENAAAEEKTVNLSENLNLLTADNQSDSGAAMDQLVEQDNRDPHVWMNPNNVASWVNVIQETLSELDPLHAAEYLQNAQSYRTKLHELDAWIVTQVADIPAQQRTLVMDHLVFGYFAEEYRFQQAGAVIPGYSTIAEPSAQQLAEIIDSIEKLGINVIFVSDTAPSGIAEQVAEDTGSRLVNLHTGSLTEPGGFASNYIDYMRYNVNAIVGALQ